MISIAKRKKKKWWPAVPVLLLILPLAVAFRLRWLSPSGTILYGPAAKELFSQCSRSAPSGVSGYFLAGMGDVSRLEKALPAYMLLQKQRGFTFRFSDYHYQYAGFTRQGRRLIYVNAFPADDKFASASWRHSAVTVCDGGPSFFGVEFDVATSRFSNVAFNGSI